MRTVRIDITVNENVSDEVLGQIAECFIGHTRDEERWLKQEGLIAEETELAVDANYRKTQ